MASTELTFADRAAHRAWLASQAALPRGFRTGCARFDFVPAEVAKPAKMTVTLIALERPTPDFAAMFTRNAFPGAPILVGRRRLEAAALGAVVVNNKISNVCAPGGVEASEALCAETGRLLGIGADAVLPSSTGVIGWKLPVAQMLGQLPAAVAALQGASVLPAAEGICTTDLYPKVRRAELPAAGGTASIVGIAKGAGMIEPNLATMLVYILTDAAVPRAELRAALAEAVDASFNRMSIDSDTSTSDTVALLASGAAGAVDRAAFRAALARVCADLTEDVVRNGEGVHHVMRVRVRGAPDLRTAVAVGKSVANSPLFQCAVAGNDPNVGRLVCAIGKWAGANGLALDPARVRLAVGGTEVFAGGAFRLDEGKERALIAHFKAAELYASVPPADGLTFRPPVSWPPHERAVQLDLDLGAGGAEAAVLGADRTHEYISENADYRS
ncbi:MAG: bifunctional ornithine acetyltransferase/N-acetylglutamate synthase [Planctomycetes bacterium]|nr:bifunctional ornithine acetyltransferase/N-acetylglutamate synthase [Planctomycetota bacterium]